MTDKIDLTNLTEEEIAQQTEVYFEKAKKLGLKPHHKAKLEKLVEMVTAKMAEDSEEKTETKSAKKDSGLETPQERRERLRRKANKLVRVRVTCMNPNKKEWSGEILTASNSVIGTVRKFIPFGQETYVPQILLNMMEERQFQFFETKRDKRTGQQTRKPRLVKEFGIEKLKGLTKKELEELAKQQAAAGSIDNEG